MMPTNNKITTLLFDLGKVIIDVDPQKTLLSLKNATKDHHDKIDNLFKDEFFLKFENGQISDTDFFSYLKCQFSLSIDIEEIAKIWDGMIIGIYDKHIQLLQHLKNQFSLYAVSNTTARHIRIINNILHTNYKIINIKDLFHKSYFSFEINLSKPDKKIFQHILNDIAEEANKILFIDDNRENIQSATKMSINTIYLQDHTQLLFELKKLGALHVSY